jgi:quercetin dioxygenase-like cupin family protein
MRRMALRSLALATLLALPLLAIPARAQDATPPPTAADMIELLAPIELPDSAALTATRVTLQPGEMVPLHPHAAIEMTFIAAGSATLRIAEGPPVLGVRGAGEEGATPEAAGPGAELTVTAGDVVIVPPGNVFEARAGEEGVTVLIFGFAAQAGAGTPTA